LNKKLKKGLQLNANEPSDAFPVMTPLLRAWQALTNVFGGVMNFGDRKKSDATKSRPAAKTEPSTEQNENDQPSQQNHENQTVTTKGNYSSQDIPTEHSATIFVADPQTHNAGQSTLLSVNQEYETSPTQPAGETVTPSSEMTPIKQEPSVDANSNGGNTADATSA
jgi:hypothetical protein